MPCAWSRTLTGSQSSPGTNGMCKLRDFPAYLFSEITKEG